MIPVSSSGVCVCVGGRGYIGAGGIRGAGVCIRVGCLVVVGFYREAFSVHTILLPKMLQM